MGCSRTGVAGQAHRPACLFNRAVWRPSAPRGTPGNRRPSLGCLRCFWALVSWQRARHSWLPKERTMSAGDVLEMGNGSVLVHLGESQTFLGSLVR